MSFISHPLSFPPPLSLSLPLSLPLSLSFQSQADISNIPDNTSEAQQALDRALLHSEELYHFLQKHIQESQVSSHTYNVHVQVLYK